MEPMRPKAILVVAKAATLADAAPYPRELERVVTLRDGAVVRVRPIRPDDESRLVALFGRLSERTVYQRFFTTYRQLPAAWYRDFANVDYRARLALVAEEVGADGVRLRGVARWEPGDAPDAVEIALAVEDAWQGRGLGASLLGALIDAARGRGIERFCADVLAENHRMLGLLRTLTRVRDSSVSQGVVHLCLVPKASAVA
ncbi:MAG: GNAT family N-acetyltransferase [Candidatus Rokubacteria bacterium]|nr:GNAT family N-acetyltransferase [Candidatus Rokubacteria bacterium]